jgi:hypothetical protein
MLRIGKEQYALGNAFALIDGHASERKVRYAGRGIKSGSNLGGLASLRSILYPHYLAAEGAPWVE